MALQSARHFNRAREKLVKHTHTHTHSPQDREERLAHCGMAVWRESACALRGSARVMATHDEGNREMKDKAVCVCVCVCVCVSAIVCRRVGV